MLAENNPDCSSGHYSAEMGQNLDSKADREDPLPFPLRMMGREARDAQGSGEWEE